jgi:hypothetical protein
LNKRSGALSEFASADMNICFVHAGHSFDASWGGWGTNPAGAEQAEEKCRILVKTREQTLQGLKPILYFVAFAARLKSCPSYKTGRN